MARRKTYVDVQQRARSGGIGAAISRAKAPIPPGYFRAPDGSIQSYHDLANLINAQNAQAAPPKVDPFFTPEDLLAIGEWVRGANDARAEWTSRLQSAQTEHGLSTQQNQKAKTQGLSDVNDTAAARGIFRSSIRNAGLYDVEATAAMQQNLLDSRMKQVTVDYDTWVTRYGGTTSDGRKIATTEEEAKATGAPIGTEAANAWQNWSKKAAGNAIQASKDWKPPPMVAVPAKPKPLGGAPAPAAAPRFPGAAVPTGGTSRPQATTNARGNRVLQTPAQVVRASRRPRVVGAGSRR